MPLKAAIYLLVTPVMLMLAILACSGQLAHLQVRDVPQYVCPTPPPRPTDVMPAPPVVGVGTPQPPPQPTYTPYPTVTPYVLRPPQDIHMGDAVFTDAALSPARVRVRMDALRSVNTPKGQIAVWELEVKNVGQAPYELFPAAQTFVSRVNGQAGVWGAGQAAAREAGIPFEYTAHTLNAGESLRLTLAAYTPPGAVEQLTYWLDPTQPESPNAVTWTPTRNPHCAGDVQDPR